MKRGFSLIEIMVVVALLGIMAIGIPQYLRSRQGAQVREARQRVSEDLRYARELAVAGGGKRQMVFACEGGTPCRYEIRDGETLVKAGGLTTEFEMGRVHLEFQESGRIDEGTAVPAPVQDRVTIQIRLSQTTTSIVLGQTTGLPVE